MPNFGVEKGRQAQDSVDEVEPRHSIAIPAVISICPLCLLHNEEFQIGVRFMNL